MSFFLPKGLAKEILGKERFFLSSASSIGVPSKFSTLAVISSFPSRTGGTIISSGLKTGAFRSPFSDFSGVSVDLDGEDLTFVPVAAKSSLILPLVKLIRR